MPAKQRSPVHIHRELIAFDDEYEGGFFLKLVQQAAKDAGWRAHVYEDVTEARNQLANTIGAVVTGLGVPRKPSPVSSTEHVLGAGRFPAEPLIETTQKLGRPVAVISDHPHANNFLKPKNGDILLPRHPHLELPDRFMEWLNVIIEPVKA